MADETKPAPASTDTSAGERRPPRSGPGGGREGGPGGQGGRKFFRRKKVCKFCTEKIEAINYKDVRLLAQFVAESGKIVNNWSGFTFTYRRLTSRFDTSNYHALARTVVQPRDDTHQTMPLQLASATA